MKKQFTQLCIAMAILLGFNTASKAQATLYMDSVSNVCTVGTIVHIPVRIKNFTAITSYQGTIKWDTAVLQYSSVTYGSVDSICSLTKYLVNTDSVLNGQFAFLWSDPDISNYAGETQADTSIIVTFNFKIKKLIVGKTPVSFELEKDAFVSASIADSALGGSTVVNAGFLSGYVGFVSSGTISKSGTLLTVIPSGYPSSYQWRFNGTPIPGATKVSYDFANISGSYDCVVSYSNGCSAISSPLLPISLKDFVGYYKDGIANISWSIANENAAYFNVQVSSNGKDFVTLKKVLAASSNYIYSDASGTQNSKVYYRLQIVENDGSTTYSKVLVLTLNNSTSITVFPNPVKSILNLQIQNSKTETVSVQVMDLLGKILSKQSAQLNAGLNNVSLNVASLTRGNYIVVVKGESLLQQQFIKY